MAWVSLAGGALVAVLVLPGIWRDPPDPVERIVWSRFRLVPAAIALGLLGSGLVQVTHVAGAAVAGAVLDGGCLVALAVWFTALIRWNQARTQISDAGIWLNGVSSVLVLTALLQLAFAQSRAVHTWPVQLDLLATASVFVVLGTATSVPGISGLVRDVRIWLVISALVLLQVTAFTPGAADRIAWVVAALVIAGCARLRPRLDPPKPVTAHATVVGSLVCAGFGLAALALDTGIFTEVDHLVTAYAVVGSIGAGARIVRLVGDQVELTRRQAEALTDELTGIANRRALLSAIDICLARNMDPPISLMILGLDRFKTFNDRHGHSAGDLLLRRTATALADATPAGAMVARLGSDEFAVLLVGAASTDAVRVAGNLAGVVEAIADADPRAQQVGVSVGVASAEGVQKGGELLHRADAAMYQAKSSRSVLRLYDQELDAAAQEVLILTEDLREAVRRPVRRVPTPRASTRDQIAVFFQPQIEMSTGLAVGAEALVRWQHPTRGLLTPDRFLDLAEENGLMADLTEAVLRRAVEQSRRWRAIGHPLRLSVNLSASSLGGPWLLPLVEEVLTEGVSPQSLLLEVTESTLMTDPEQALAAMHRITGLGVGISIDDYGTGYSSLSYMNDLPASELKIDRSFISRILTDRRTEAIVAATVDLAHRLGMRLVAEGVEDEATFAAVSGLGCDLSQGYLHSRPLPADDFVQWVTDPRNHLPVSTSHISSREVRPG